MNRIASAARHLVGADTEQSSRVSTPSHVPDNSHEKLEAERLWRNLAGTYSLGHGDAQHLFARLWDNRRRHAHSVTAGRLGQVALFVLALHFLLGRDAGHFVLALSWAVQAGLWGWSFRHSLELRAYPSDPPDMPRCGLALSLWAGILCLGMALGEFSWGLGVDGQ